MRGAEAFLAARTRSRCGHCEATASQEQRSEHDCQRRNRNQTQPGRLPRRSHSARDRCRATPSIVERRPLTASTIVSASTSRPRLPGGEARRAEPRSPGVPRRTLLARRTRARQGAALHTVTQPPRRHTRRSRGQVPPVIGDPARRCRTPLTVTKRKARGGPPRASSGVRSSVSAAAASPAQTQLQVVLNQSPASDCDHELGDA